MHTILRAFALTIATFIATTPVQAQGEYTPPPIEAYGTLPKIEIVALSAGGNVAMLGTFEGERMVVIADANNRPIKTVLVGEVKVRDVEWAGEHTVIIRRSDTVDVGLLTIKRWTEWWNTMVIPVNRPGEVHTVFSDDPKVLNTTIGMFGYRKRGDRWFGYFAGLPKERIDGEFKYRSARVALYRVDLQSNDNELLDRGAGNGWFRQWVIDDRGEIAAYLDGSSTEERWKLFDAQGNQLALGEIPGGWVHLEGLTSDGGAVIYHVGFEDSSSKLWAVPLGGGPARPMFENIEGGFDRVFTHPHSSRIAGYFTEAEPDRPVFYSRAEQEKVGGVANAFEPINGTVRDWTADASKVLVRTSGNGDAGNWYAVDTASSGMVALGAERPQLQPIDIGMISQIEYEASDGLDIEAILTRPPGKLSRNLPLVVLPHGGPRAHDDMNFDWWAQAIASRGYAVLQPNFRGSTNAGTEFMEAGNGEWGRKMQTDLSDGIAALVAEGIVDPARVCIVGASYGGYAALAGVTLQQGIYRCAASVGGVSDLRRMVNREFRNWGDHELRDFREELIGPRSSMDAISPAKHADKADAPILLIHGRDDTVVPFEQSYVMADALKDAGKRYELIELDDEDHWLSREATRLQMLRAVIAFLETHNPPD